ncbi:zinc finger protein SHOOT GRAVITROPISM 5-like isoform X1 [Primulina tabacum]|uniref:zinc finger protein SHOOT GRAVITROPISM 5-like isoform X1 n=2 Tax=Primulina tabacum TaxID=48773 RepID=UPI003F592592
MMYNSSQDVNGFSNERKRRPPGTPDPNAEVVSLSSKTLLESDRYVCEICNQGFQRDQNLQMHMRRHKVPWKLLKRDNPQAKNRVFVCPDETCLHHDPKHALGDLVGIKKHFRRKHSNNKPWVCERCSKGYAVQSDFKAHVRTCGTRGHSCDCGRVFSRVESFIEHQDSCTIRHDNLPQELQHPTQPEASSSPTASSSTTPSMEYSNFSAVSVPRIHPKNPGERDENHQHNLELQLLPSSTKFTLENDYICKPGLTSEQQLDFPMAENGLAEEAVRQARQQIELAELEFAKAERIRQQALADLEKARVLKEQFTKKISSTILEITCHACKQKFQAITGTLPTAAESSSAMNYVSSAKLKLKKLTD